MWHDDGSNAVRPGASEAEFVVSGLESGSPVNAKFDKALSSGQYFEVKVLACEAGSSPFIGVTSAAGFGQGWKCRGLFFGGPGNLSSGGALAFGAFGQAVGKGMTIGVYIEYSDCVNVTFYQDGRCLGPAFVAQKLSDGPIYPVVHTSREGDSFAIDFPAKAPVQKEREALNGGKLPAAAGYWLLDSMTSSEAADVDLAGKMPDGEQVRLEVEAEAENKFLIGIHVVNRLRCTVTAATAEPSPPHSQALTPGRVASTKMMGPPEMMEVEGAVSSMLESLSSWQVESDKLTLLAQGGQMVFSRNVGGEGGLPVNNVELP